MKKSREIPEDSVGASEKRGGMVAAGVSAGLLAVAIVTVGGNHVVDELSDFMRDRSQEAARSVDSSQIAPCPVGYDGLPVNDLVAVSGHPNLPAELNASAEVAVGAYNGASKPSNYNESLQFAWDFDQNGNAGLKFVEWNPDVKGGYVLSPEAMCLSGISNTVTTSPSFHEYTNVYNGVAPEGAFRFDLHKSDIS